MQIKKKIMIWRGYVKINDRMSAPQHLLETNQTLDNYNQNWQGALSFWERNIYN